MKKDKLKKLNPYITLLFIIVEVIVYAIFIWKDITSLDDTTAYKFFAICLCFAFSLYNILNHETDGIILSCALFFTIISDLITLVIDDYYVLGVSCFIIVQSIYMLRITLYNGKPLYKTIIVRVLIISAVLIGLIIAESFDSLTFVSAIYFSMLLINSIESVFIRNKSFYHLIFCIGLWLFVCCDISVGLYNIPDVLGVTISYSTYDIIGTLMWAFYLPSQVLIVLSANDEKYSPLKLK